MDAREPEKLIYGRIRNTHKEKIRQSPEGFSPSHHRFSLELLQQAHELLQSQAARCLEKRNELVELHYAEQMTLRKTLQGVSTLSAIILLAESGADMKPSESSSKFADWTG